MEAGDGTESFGLGVKKRIGGLVVFEEGEANGTNLYPDGLTGINQLVSKLTEEGQRGES